MDEWYRDQIRELVVDDRLLAEARRHRLQEDETFRIARRQAEKQIGVQLCLAELEPGVETISDQDLRAAFEAHAEELAAPERRSVYQIFLRRGPEALARIESLRERVLNGDSFSRLASEYSESETRHRKGFLGWMVPGQLPTALEKAVFGLKEGVPSEVLRTRDGFHLFYVDQVLPQKSLSFEEARPILRERIQAERQEAALADLDAEFDPPPSSLVLDRDQLAAVVKSGDPDAPVLRLGDATWTLSDLRHRVQEFMTHESTVRGAPTLELAWHVLDMGRRREELYQGCRNGGHIPSAALASRLDTWERRVLVEGERQRRLVDLALEDGDRLRLFYQSNLGDYSSPPTWEVRVLRLPLGDHPAVLMERLETAASKPGTTLTALAQALGGTIEDQGPKNLTEIGSAQPKLPGLIAPLRVGQLTAPYRTRDGLEIAEVVARTEARPIPYEEVRERVAVRYVKQYTSELYDRLRHRILQGADLRIDPDAVAALRSAGLPQPDVTVDQLEDLLGQL